MKKTLNQYSHLLVKQIDLVVESCGKTTCHSLEFDDLTVAEMKRDGFCGPVFLEDSDGVEHECEVDAYNPEDVSGPVVGGLVFKVTCPRESGLKATVVKYNARKVFPVAGKKPFKVARASV